VISRLAEFGSNINELEQDLVGFVGSKRARLYDEEKRWFDLATEIQRTSPSRVCDLNHGFNLILI
jgi:hypothetical protein